MRRDLRGPRAQEGLPEGDQVAARAPRRVRRRSTTILDDFGDEVLASHEAHELQIAPAPGSLPLDVVGLATLETGWVFFASGGWR